MKFGNVQAGIYFLWLATVCKCNHDNTSTTTEKLEQVLKEENMTTYLLQDTNAPFIQVTQDFKLHLPPGYSRTLSSYNNQTEVEVILLVHEVSDVDVKQQRMKLVVDMTLIWVDIRIRDHIIGDKDLLEKLLGTGVGFLRLHTDFLKHIWIPDIFLHESEETIEGRFPSPNPMLLWVFLQDPSTRPGWMFRFVWSTRKTLDLRCEMEFNYYPADTQKCKFNFVSYSHDNIEMGLAWSNLTDATHHPDGRHRITNNTQYTTYGRPVYLNNAVDPNFQFQISDVEPGNSQTKYYAEKEGDNAHEALTFTLRIRRNLSCHLLQTYLPSVLLVSITCLSFLLPPDMVEAQIGISMTTVLTLTAMFSTNRETSPEVSYTMAIDIWMVFCILIVFLALLLFAVIYWARRKLTLLAERHQSTGIEDKGNLAGGGGKDLKSVGRRLTLRVEYEMNKGEENMSERRRRGKILKARKVKCYGCLVNASRKFSFLAFSIIFVSFLAFYALSLLVFSNYFDWSPDPFYNAVGDNEHCKQFRFFKQSVFKDFDADGDGGLSLEELKYYASSDVCGSKNWTLEEQELVEQVFSRWDKDGNGRVTEGEFNAVT